MRINSDERITQALMRLDSARKENFENKPTSQPVQQRLNAQDYAVNTRPYHRSISHIQETYPPNHMRTGRPNRHPKGNFQYDRERSPVPENWRERSAKILIILRYPISLNRLQTYRIHHPHKLTRVINQNLRVILEQFSVWNLLMNYVGTLRRILVRIMKVMTIFA